MDTFDAAYYRRFYHDPTTQAVSPEEQQRLAAFVHAYLTHLDIPVRSIVDMGCGIGTLLEALARCFPEAKTTGVETSSYLCAQYGWRKGKVQNYRGRRADLVICSDVLGYLDDTTCEAAVENLARLTCEALYLAVLTEEDVAVCDQARTDLTQHTRPAGWYRTRLDKHFQSVGGGLYLKKPLKYALWQLEMAG